jgi:hypothetical protein
VEVAAGIMLEKLLKIDGCVDGYGDSILTMAAEQSYLLSLFNQYE